MKNRKNKVNKKGFIFSLDALFAITIAAIFLTHALIMINKNAPEPLITDSLKDSLIVLEKDGVLNDAMIRNETIDLQIYLDWLLPENLCGRLSIYDPNLTMNVTLPCWDVTKNKAITYSTFTSEGVGYVTKLEVHIDG